MTPPGSWSPRGLPEGLNPNRSAARSSRKLRPWNRSGDGGGSLRTGCTGQRTIVQLYRDRILIGIEDGDPGCGRLASKGLRSIEDSRQDNMGTGLRDSHAPVQLRQSPSAELKEGADLRGIAGQLDPGRLRWVSFKQIRAQPGRLLAGLQDQRGLVAISLGRIQLYRGICGSRT